jgi:plastocyanin
MLVLLLGGCGGGGTTDPPPPPAAQTGTVAGTVSADGSGVPGTQITLEGRGTQTTNSQGAYTFASVPIGNRNISLALPDGYEAETGQPLERTVSVMANQTATVNWGLRALQQPPATAEVDTVQISGTSFSPANLTVAPGRTVVWVYVSGGPHTVTPDGHTQWQSVSANSPGEVLRVTFNTAGTFDYYCEPHRSLGMTGEIVVQP